jgi:hypothetical protein
VSARLTKLADTRARSTNSARSATISRRLLAMRSENEPVGLNTPSSRGGATRLSSRTNLPRYSSPATSKSPTSPARGKERAPVSVDASARDSFDTDTSRPVSAATRATIASASMTETVRISVSSPRATSSNAARATGSSEPAPPRRLVLPSQSSTATSPRASRPSRRTAAWVRPLARERRSTGSRAMPGRKRWASLASSAYTPRAVRTPAAIPASALPVSLRAVSAKSTTPSAIIGTITMSAKNSLKRPRKLIPHVPLGQRLPPV